MIISVVVEGLLSCFWHLRRKNPALSESGLCKIENTIDTTGIVLRKSIMQDVTETPFSNEKLIFIGGILATYLFFIIINKPINFTSELTV